jgi:hypothetical protein
LTHDPDEARARRKAAAEKYRPSHVRLLLVAEAPPSALDRYFYFEGVNRYDDLFRYVVKTVLRTAPLRPPGKRDQLERLRECGVFLIDVKDDPKRGNERIDP